MRLRIRSTSRFSGFALWPCAFAALWATGVLTVGLIERARGLSIPLCHWKRLTGLPCPTCGGTRMLFHMIEGRVLEAFLLNPLLFVAGASFVVWMVAKLVFARSVSLECSRAEQRCIVAALAVTFATNWAYLIAAGR